MSSLVLLVELTINAGRMDAFLARAREHRSNVLSHEPDCKGFELLVPTEDGDTVFLYEVYADDAALEAHRQAPHYLKWRSIVAEMFDGDPQRIVTTTLFPSEGGWKKQKPELTNW